MMISPICRRLLSSAKRPALSARSIRWASTGEGSGSVGPSLDEHFKALKPNLQEQDAVERFEKALEGQNGIDTKAAVKDYEMLLTAITESMKLTIEWNSTAKLSEKEKVVATAKRVGLSVPEFEEKSMQ